MREEERVRTAFLLRLSLLLGALAAVEHPLLGQLESSRLGLSRAEADALSVLVLPPAAALPGRLVPCHPEVGSARKHRLRHQQRKQTRNVLVSPCWLL